jgi:AAA+ superfamily predicted ATPase
MPQISLYEQRPIGVPSTRLPRLDEPDRERLLLVQQKTIEKASLTEEEVVAFKDRLTRFASRRQWEDGALFRLLKRAKAVHRAAFWQTVLLTYDPENGTDPNHIERLRQHHLGSMYERELWHPAPEVVVSQESQRWLSNVRSDTGIGSGFHQSPIARRPDPEYAAAMELLAVVNSQMVALPTSDRQDARRPPIVLSMLNGTGKGVADSIIDDVATDLKADVVHLSAHHLARLLGPYLGQTQYSARGSLSMLGYAAAEMNGRVVSRYIPTAGSGLEPDQIGAVAVELPVRLRNLIAQRELGINGLDGRWEDMKIDSALETIVAAVDQKREREVTVTKACPSIIASIRPENELEVKELRRDLIIHLHDYVEVNSLYRSIINKLRSIADRMWKAGRRVVFVGSSSGDLEKLPEYREQLAELARDGAHVIPFHADPARTDSEEKWNNAEENLANIEDMLRAVVGDQVPITFTKGILHSKDPKVSKKNYDIMFGWLNKHMLDAEWVQRLVSLVVGARMGPREEYGVPELCYGMQFMLDRDKHWQKINPEIVFPYSSPLGAPRNPPSPNNNNLSGAAASKQYTVEEKKLLSGLINAKDIHTTFDHIVVPQDTKESLIGLTTLSLVRPEAFSYGVLKTEHIPGCMLYGPPGTGKTLLAKAVAKESGASMLEVSAASINDKYVGQSEKNVQALFSLARKLAPCVIFLDEADALLAARRSGSTRAAYRETITQFLREWDGLTGSRAFIMVATNRPFDLDEAVLRRLPRKILVDLPLSPERQAILRVMLQEEVLAPDVDLARLADDTELYSGSDLKNLCVSAAMEAVREEVRAKAAWKGEGEFQWPEKRVLEKRHFDKGLRDISASISGDMDSLKAIRKFDEQYGDAGRKRVIKKGMGFQVVPDDGKGSSREARVRQVDVNAAA